MVLAIVAVFFFARPAEAVEILQLKPWPFGEAEAVVARLPNLKKRMRWYKEQSMRDLWGGYLDLDLDGVDELIVMEGTQGSRDRQYPGLHRRRPGQAPGEWRGLGIGTEPRRMAQHPRRRRPDAGRRHGRAVHRQATFNRVGQRHRAIF